jgi:hypothetical protein
MGMRAESESRARAFRPLALVLATAAGLLRLLPHPWNFTPLPAASLFAGARLNGWLAFALPLAVVSITDLVVNLLHGYALVYPDMPFVYAAYLVNVLIGKLLCRSESPLRLGAAALAVSVQFFLVSNFGVWAVGGIYPHDLGGLAACYVAGLAFFRHSLLGDLFYAGLLFGAHAWLSRTVFPAERVAVAAPEPFSLEARATP